MGEQGGLKRSASVKLHFVAPPEKTDLQSPKIYWCKKGT